MLPSNSRDAVLTDQLSAVRNTVAIAIPINLTLSAASLLVAIHAGKSFEGAVWFLASLTINSLRIFLCRLDISEATSDRSDRRLRLGAEAHLRAHWITALISGCVWAFIPALCDWYTSEQTLFYLTVVCGITAGAAIHGFAYSRVAMSFFTPPLVSGIICLVAVGGFERYVLAATVVLYLGALIRVTRVGEALIRKNSRMKNEATSLSKSLEVANAQKTAFAEEMQRRALRDSLTGLYNRHGFTEKLEKLAASSDPQGTLMLLDLDGFKSVNDSFGHKAGDRVLVEVARRLFEAVGEDATLARLGGDEFAVLLENRLIDEDAELLATRLITTISIPFSKLDAGRVGASVGVYSGDARDMDEIMVYADTALYAAKREGRNRFRLFDDGLRRKAQITRDIERDLPNALANETLQLWYQPIMGDYGKSLDAFEALLRWKHPKHGWISPPDLVAAAAANGFAEPLLRFILREAALMALTLRSIGATGVRISINISPRELVQIAVDDLLLNKLESFGVSPSMLELEITEEAAINPRLVQEKLARLSNSGVRLAIDDFGTGYSSLGMLQQLRVDRVKIDKSFVTGTTLSSSTLVDAVLRVSHAYGFDVVAEGVETEEDLATMRALGCSVLQGNLFAAAMPKNKALAWLEDYNDTRSGKRT